MGSGSGDPSALTPAERQRLLVTWNTTAAGYQRDRCLHELFEAQVERTPDHIAAAFEHERLTYRELNRRANRLAQRLRALGVGPEVLVGLYLERSLDMLVGLLGILKSGGAYVPLDRALPRDRIALVLDDAGVPVLLTRASLVPALPEHRARVACVDVDVDEMGHSPAGNVSGGAAAENLAYVLYTSGSTGRPKGVLGTHRAVVNRVSFIWHAHPFGADEVACQRTPLGFVDSVREIFAPLLQGVATVIVPDEALADPRRLIRVLADGGVTRISLVPSLLELLLDSAADLQSRVPRLRHWVTSGEALSAALVQRFRRSLPGSVLVNRYGATEGSATWCDATDHATAAPVPIGRPFANTVVYLLDPRMEPVPIGQAGELYVGGDDLARGYLKRPDLTAEKFVPHPFAGEPGARLYRTGDLARYRPDGAIEYLGRSDYQVRLRGARVELGEIEAVLRQHPRVRDVVVTLGARASGEQMLVAYVVPAEPARAAPSELRQFLQARLPGPLWPHTFVWLDFLPLTPNGKVDRSALPAAGRSRPPLDVPYAAPRTPLEKLVAGVWADVLGLETIGVADSFLALGGDSLLAARVVTRVSGALGTEVSGSALLGAPTVADQALAIFQDALRRLGETEAGRLLDRAAAEDSRFGSAASP